MPEQKRPQVLLPEICAKHQRLLFKQARYGPHDPWQSLYMMAQIVLFQCTTAHPATYDKIGGDVTRIGELGCLACYRPDAFGEIVEAAKTHDLGQIKAIGERWMKEAQDDNPTQG